MGGGAAEVRVRQHGGPGVHRQHGGEQSGEQDRMNFPWPRVLAGLPTKDTCISL